MKRILIISSLLFTISQAQAIKSIELQIEGWNENSFGTFQSKGSVIDLSERGLKSKFVPSITLDLKGVSDYLNFKFGFTKIKNEGKKVLPSDMQQNGVNFDKGELLKSTYNLDIYDAIYYIKKTQDDLVNIELGVGLRYFSGSYKSKTCSRETKTSFHKLINTGYLRAEITPKWTKPVKWVNQVIISPIDNIYIDARTALKTEIYKNISIETGYRYNRFDSDGKYNANIKSHGLYGAISYKFKF